MSPKVIYCCPSLTHTSTNVHDFEPISMHATSRYCKPFMLRSIHHSCDTFSQSRQLDLCICTRQQEPINMQGVSTLGRFGRYTLHNVDPIWIGFNPDCIEALVQTHLKTPFLPTEAALPKGNPWEGGAKQYRLLLVVGWGLTLLPLPIPTCCRLLAAQSPPPEGHQYLRLSQLSSLIIHQGRLPITLWELTLSN